ncbi:MAG: SagB/ThcOx family dehydrogenase [Planctomycetota bacterium]
MPSPLETILRYHDETKHHPHRYARSAGYLDWDTQPHPFRHFEGAAVVRLPWREDDDTPPYESLFVPGAVEPVPLSLPMISRFFELALAISAWKRHGGVAWALRCNPSSGNLHPTEGYVVLPPLAELDGEAGVYHYDPREHALERRLELPRATFDALVASPQPMSHRPFLAGLSSIHWREAWKYGERAYRYCQLDLGHAVACLRLSAAALGWRVTVIGAAGDSDVEALLGLDRAAEFVREEREVPGPLAVVFPSTLGEVPHVDLDVATSVARLRTNGRANRLSPEHVKWPIIEATAEAAWKPRTPPIEIVREGSLPSAVPPPPVRPCTARLLIRERRSAVAFDGTTAMPRQAFERLLMLLLPDEAGQRPPWDAIDWQAAVHLILFVHAIEGLDAGLYAFVRSPAALARLKAATRMELAWEAPPGWPLKAPLYLLQRGEWRARAARLSLGQEIAGDGAFSLGMLAEFEDPLRSLGPWFYRRLFWEAGLIGQILYLEAEAAGLRGTGIGAYFDDLVHEALGLKGRSFQSLYHFTVGGPVEDTRITSLPAPCGGAATKE